MNLELPAQRYDGVFANAVLFHVPSQVLPQVLLQLRACLRPGGVLFSSNPRGNGQEGWNGDRYGAFHDWPTWRALMTAALPQQMLGQLAERERQSGGQPNQTEVVMIEARLLGIEDLGEGHMASVEFSGMVREDGAAGPNPFREIWSIARAKAGGGGWLVAGVLGWVGMRAGNSSAPPRWARHRWCR